MKSFVIQPNSHAAHTAASQVRKSLEVRKYTHYVLVHGKQKGSATIYSHMDITTSSTKAEQEGYLTPQQWLEIFNNPVKYMVGKAS